MPEYQIGRRFIGRTALVIGGGMDPARELIGNGSATAERLAQEGATVVVADRELDRAQATVDRLAAPGIALAADVTDIDQCRGAVTQAEKLAGPLDVLVCNVGFSGHLAALEQTVEDWEFTNQLNVRSHWLAAQTALPGMIERGRGSILFISSVAGIRSSGRSMAYEVTKSAVNSLARHFAVAYSQYGVRTNALAPGLIDSAMVRRSEFWNLDGKNDDKRAKGAPMGRQGRPEEIAAAAAFLASEDASYVSGTCLVVDGGRTAQAVVLDS